MVLTIPLILYEYYDEIEQDLSTTRNKTVLDDCEYIIGELQNGEWYDHYSKKDIAALKRFRTMLKNNMGTAIVVYGYKT